MSEHIPLNDKQSEVSYTFPHDADSPALNLNNEINSDLQIKYTDQQTLKSQATGESHENNQERDWETVQPRRNNKGMNNSNDIVDRQNPTTFSRTFSNSNQNKSVNLNGKKQHKLHSPSLNNRIPSSSLSNQRKTTNGENQLPITNYALDYASNYHFSPFKLECQPKIRDRKDGTKLINDLIKLITPGFLIQNPRFSHDILFDLWWIDPDGNIQIIIKTTDLYVYLCKQDRYPNQLNNVKINPIPPTHLPPQHTAIIKWVNNFFSDDDVRDELNMKFESVFLIESMQGTINERNRHIKVEMLDKNEFNKLLNNGKINLGGQLYSVDEYLPSPRILICNRCNLPGHTKKSCRNSDVDLCRRCGKPRTNIEEHKECEIKCHHCQENHLATDYKCKIIDKYRRELIEELKKHPERLPPEVQLFIPSEYRSDDRRKTIYNEEAYHQNQYVQQQQFYNRSDENAWPGLNTTNAPTTTATVAVTNNLSEAIKNLSENLEEEKKRHEAAQQQIEEKYKASVQMMNQAWLLVKQVQQTQEMMVSSMSKALNQGMFRMCAKSIEILQLVITKLKTRVRNIELDDVTELINNQGFYINEAYKEFDRHQEEFKTISSRQNEVVTALDILFQQING